MSVVGDMVFDTTLVLWVATVLAKGKTWASAAVSGILLTVALAVLVVMAINARRTSWLGLLVGGLLVVLFSRQSVFWAGMLSFFLIAIPVTMLNTGLVPLLLEAKPREFLGRVIAVFNRINQAASMISVVLAGGLASSVLLHLHADVAGLHMGRSDTIFTVAGLLIVAAGVYASIAFPTMGSSASSADAGAPAEDKEPSAVPSQPATEPTIQPVIVRRATLPRFLDRREFAAPPGAVSCQDRGWDGRGPDGRVRSGSDPAFAWQQWPSICDIPLACPSWIGA
ncbi:MAG TPA: hypothetical protein VH442_14210 [Micromonosporaceae bacterium]